MNSKQDPTRFYGILDKIAMESISMQTRSYKIRRDTRQKWYGSHMNSKQDPTRFSGILDKNARESISLANKILQDP